MVAPEDHQALEQFGADIAPTFRDLARAFWKPPTSLADQITPAINEFLGEPDVLRVVVSGETDNISLYVVGVASTIAYAPFSSIRNSPVVREAEVEILAQADDHLLLLRTKEPLVRRLSLPVVALINPCVAEVFPAPRLPLCICSLAAYLRQRQKADVHLIDMQLDADPDSAVHAAQALNPSIIGISISFGQTNAAIALLQRLYAGPRPPLVVLGNVIAAFAAGKFIELFPKLIIARTEGEVTLSELVDYAKGERRLEDVSGITYHANGRLVSVPPADFSMEDIPLPSMDFVEDLTKKGGALTMELSRGCFHSACSFCPRTHKPRKWKGISATQALKQLTRYAQLLDHLCCERRIFMADEEFIGWNHEDTVTERINAILEGMLSNKLNLRFETNTRIDQIYNPRKDRAWHGKRLAMLGLCRDSGLERLLVGVESGSDSVLKRFNKNIAAQDSVMALRLLSAIGIGFRITFITFDPLMPFTELRENVTFLARQDVYLKPLNCRELGWENLYDAVHDDGFIAAHTTHVPLHEYVSYMLVSLEVFRDSTYATFFCGDQPGMPFSDVDHFDMAMARHRVRYADATIGAIAMGCQKWIDRHFALGYYLKGLYKILPGNAREAVFGPRREYRHISFDLLRFLVAVFGPPDSPEEASGADVQDFRLRAERLSAEGVNAMIEEILDQFHARMLEVVRKIEGSLACGSVQDPAGGLVHVIERWRASRGWALLNP
jgi:radical SAM superfamily enzyme YgiQ (UPF0313 family)